MNMFSLIPTTAEIELDGCECSGCMGCTGCIGCFSGGSKISIPPDKQ